jgi:hypothetical protein
MDVDGCDVAGVNARVDAARKGVGQGQKGMRTLLMTSTTSLSTAPPHEGHRSKGASGHSRKVSDDDGGGAVDAARRGEEEGEVCDENQEESEPLECWIVPGSWSWETLEVPPCKGYQAWGLACFSLEVCVRSGSGPALLKIQFEEAKLDLDFTTGIYIDIQTKQAPVTSMTIKPLRASNSSSTVKRMRMGTPAVVAAQSNLLSRPQPIPQSADRPAAPHPPATGPAPAARSFLDPLNFIEAIRSVGQSAGLISRPLDSVNSLLPSSSGVNVNSLLPSSSGVNVMMDVTNTNEPEWYDVVSVLEEEKAEFEVIMLESSGKGLPNGSWSLSSVTVSAEPELQVDHKMGANSNMVLSFIPPRVLDDSDAHHKAVEDPDAVDEKAIGLHVLKLQAKCLISGRDIGASIKVLVMPGMQQLCSSLTRLQ